MWQNPDKGQETEAKMTLHIQISTARAFQERRLDPKN
jgi:hypothetical protein